MATSTPTVAGKSKDSCCVGFVILCIVLLFVTIAHTFIVHPIYQHVMRSPKPTKFGHLASHLMNREKFSKISTWVLFNVLKTNNFTVRWSPPGDAFIGKARRIYLIKHDGVERALKTLLYDGPSANDPEMLQMFSRISNRLRLIDCLATFELSKCSSLARRFPGGWATEYSFLDQALYSQALYTFNHRTTFDEMIGY